MQTWHYSHSSLKKIELYRFSIMRLLPLVKWFFIQNSIIYNNVLEWMNEGHFTLFISLSSSYMWTRNTPKSCDSWEGGRVGESAPCIQWQWKWKCVSNSSYCIKLQHVNKRCEVRVVHIDNMLGVFGHSWYEFNHNYVRGDVWLTWMNETYVCMQPKSFHCHHITYILGKTRGDCVCPYKKDSSFTLLALWPPKY